MTVIARVLWQFYAIILVMLTVVGIADLVRQGEALLPITISALLTCVYLVGLYGYVYKEAIGPRVMWRILFWINVVAYSAKAMLMLLHPATHPLGETMFSITLVLPMLIALFLYSRQGNVVWGGQSWSATGGEKILVKLLENASCLSATTVTETDSGLLKTQVDVSHANDGYTVTIKRECDGDRSLEENRFTDLGALIQFVEENTSVRISDFAGAA